MVCTGNICRSPLAEHVLAKKMEQTPEIRVSSAGTQAMVGEPMYADTKGIAQSLGVETGGMHQARQLTETILQSSDLVLTMSREQRSIVVGLNPKMTRRTFTIREFARLADATTNENLRTDIDFNGSSRVNVLRQAVQSVSLSRMSIPPVMNQAEDEVIDPYRRSLDVHHESAEQLIPALDALSSLLDRAGAEADKRLE